MLATSVFHFVSNCHGLLRLTERDSKETRLLTGTVSGWALCYSSWYANNIAFSLVWLLNVAIKVQKITKQIILSSILQ